MPATLLPLVKNAHALDPSTQRNDDTSFYTLHVPVNSCSAICLALGSGRRFGTLCTIASSPSTSSRIGSCAAPGTSGFSGLTGSDPAGNPPILNLQTVASHQSCFLLVSRRCCTHCFLCTQLYNLGIENLSTPSGLKHPFSLQDSNLCGTCNLCHHTTQ